MNIDLRLKESAYLLAQLRSQFEGLNFENLLTEYKKENPECTKIEMIIFIKRIHPEIHLSEIFKLVEKFLIK